MAKREEIERRVEEMLLPILDEFGFDLWDVGFVKEGKEYYLRAYIDKEGGIMIDDCVDVSRRLSDALDADDFIEEAYTLEVSSPGLGRKLVKDREFDRSIGRDVDVKFYKPVDGTKELT
ncbi:MAG: ribosome maturation factor RimP, partial [Lachnospiraceae bacterium]|nr:ribosome maturation factor RimP [Lachnospiraceae bacterium]